MADLVYHFEPTIPAGTPAAAPVTVDMSFPPALVDQLTIEVPDGFKGAVGFRVTSDGTAVIPTQAGKWIVVNDRIFEIPLTNQLDSGRWALTGYNTGNFPHTVKVTFFTRLTGADAVAPNPLGLLVDPAALAF